MEEKKITIGLLLYIAVISFFFTGEVRADIENTAAIYSCVPHKVWDAGYQVKIIYDLARK